jgi:DNA-binding transcriptional ArsR family regulator
MPTMAGSALDYPIDDQVEASTPSQLRAIGHRTRSRILDLVLDRAATTAQLATALGLPKGTVGYHLRVLADAGLVRVVATQQVRGVVAKYYGRVGRTIVIKGDYLGGDSPAPMLTEALHEAAEAVESGIWDAGAPTPTFTLRHVRLDDRAAAEFAARVMDLALEFTALPRAGDTVYAFIAGVYPTTHPTLPANE